MQDSPKLSEIAAAASKKLDNQFADLQLSEGLAKAAKLFAEIAREFNTALSETWAKTFAPLRKVIEEFDRRAANAARVEAAGWLPHRTGPDERLIENEVDPTRLRTLLSNHYRENWQLIERDFRDGLDTYSIDQEAKDAFAEALTAHRLGLYRASCRVLFPEIERVARLALYDGKLKGITSLPELHETVNKLPFGDILSYMYGVRLFEKFGERLYRNIGDSTAELDACKADPVPNRHAVIHGLVPYSSENHSLNALVMTDFTFHLISVVERRIAAGRAKKALLAQTP